jgi:hypothetical protein
MDHLQQLAPYIIFGVGLLVTIIGGYYGFVRKMENRVTIIEQRCINHQVIIDSIATLNTRIEKVTNDNETFWKILGPHLADIIHSPMNRERDELVDEFVHGELRSEQQFERLIDLLHEAIYSGRWTGDKRLAGALLLARAKSEYELKWGALS